MDILGNLPVELAQDILLRLSPDDVHNAWHCCMNWRFQMDDENFWKKKCRLDEFKEFEENARSETYYKCIQHYPNYWMGVYMYCRALNSNWKNNVFKKVTVLGRKSYIALQYLDDEIAILSTLHNNFVVVDSNTGEIQKVYIVEQPVLGDLEKYKDLVVGHGYRCLKVWNIRSRECVFQHLVQHTCDLLKAITVYKNFAVTLNYIAFLRIYDMETSKIVYKRDEVEMACFDNDILALAKLNGEIEVLDINFSLMHVLRADRNSEPLRIVIKGDYMIYFSCYNFTANSNSSFAFVWNVRTAKLLHKITPIFEYSSCIFLQEDKLIYTSTDNDGKRAFKICNFVTGKLLVTLHTDSNCTAANSKFMFMESSLYGDVDGWCLKTGNVIVRKITSNCLGLKMTERKLAYFNNRTLSLHILDYEHNLKY